MNFIPTDNGNYFIEARAGKKTIYFFMDPETGNHLDENRPFHEPRFYAKAQKTWEGKEQELTGDALFHAQVIVACFMTGRVKRKVKELLIKTKF